MKKIAIAISSIACLAVAAVSLCLAACTNEGNSNGDHSADNISLTTTTAKTTAPDTDVGTADEEFNTSDGGDDN